MERVTILRAWFPTLAARAEELTEPARAFLSDAHKHPFAPHALLVAVLLLLLLQRRRLQAARASASPMKAAAGIDNLPTELPGSLVTTAKPATTAVDSSVDTWWASPLASAAEAAIIAEATALVDDADKPLPPHSHISMLRQLRCRIKDKGKLPSAEAVKDGYINGLRWRREHSPPFPGGRTAVWPASEQLTEGAWAKEFTTIGICLGRARGGHPVKVERIGQADLARITRTPGGEERMLLYYYSLLEAMLTALDAESEACGRLLSIYEVFDFKGMSIWQVSVPVIRFAHRLIAAVVTTYAETTVRAALINVPGPIALPLRGILAVLPERVARRVIVLGEGEPFDFVYDDLDDEAKAFLHASPAEVTSHSGTTFPGVTVSLGTDLWPERQGVPPSVGSLLAESAPAPPAAAHDDAQKTRVEYHGPIFLTLLDHIVRHFNPKWGVDAAKPASASLAAKNGRAKAATNSADGRLPTYATLREAVAAHSLPDQPMSPLPCPPGLCELAMRNLHRFETDVEPQALDAAWEGTKVYKQGRGVTVRGRQRTDCRSMIFRIDVVFEGATARDVDAAFGFVQRWDWDDTAHLGTFLQGPTPLPDEPHARAQGKRAPHDTLSVDLTSNCTKPALAGLVKGRAFVDLRGLRITARPDGLETHHAASVYLPQAQAPLAPAAQHWLELAEAAGMIPSFNLVGGGSRLVERVRDDGTRVVEALFLTSSEIGGGLPIELVNNATPGALHKLITSVAKYLATKQQQLKR